MRGFKRPIKWEANISKDSILIAEPKIWNCCKFTIGRLHFQRQGCCRAINIEERLHFTHFEIPDDDLPEVSCSDHLLSPTFLKSAAISHQNQKIQLHHFLFAGCSGWPTPPWPLCPGFLMTCVLSSELAALPSIKSKWSCLLDTLPASHPSEAE